MKKAKSDLKKRTGKPRKSPEKRALYTLAGLGIILILSIVVLLLLPDNNIIKTSDSGENTIDEGTPGPGKIDKTTQPSEEPREENDMGKTPEPYREKEEIPVHRGKIAVVIDDAGNNIGDLLPFLQFPHPLTIAVLPQLPYSRESALLSAEAGKEVILHLPMEPERELDPGPGALYETQSREEIIRIIKDNFESVPGARGANNHMGSKLTADPRVMEIILNYFSEHALFFLDSRTTNKTICREIASRTGVPFLERNIFLDYESDTEITETIRTQMKKGIALAQKNEYVILIGHVQNSEIVDILYEVLPEVEQTGITFIGLSEIPGK